MGLLHSWARALGGEVRGDQVLCPGPGHSAADRSLAVKVGRDGGPLCFSHSGDDALACKDYVREKLGLPAFKNTYEFRDPVHGEIRYRKERVEEAGGRKSFVFKPAGRNGSEPLLYGGERLADVGEGQPVFVVEGEKKVDRLFELGSVAVSLDSGSSSKWLPSHAALLRGLDVVLWPDSDDPGEKYVARAAECLMDVAASIKVVRPFGKPNGAKGRDVCDWAGGESDLAALVAGAENYNEIVDDGLPHLRIFNPVDWEGKQPPKRLWVVRDYIPDRAVTLLYADGGTGKSYLELQLAVARALAKEWIGLMPAAGRTIVCSTEDDADEMWRRIDGMLGFYGARMADLGDIRLVDLAGEISVLGRVSKGVIEPTQMYQSIKSLVADFRPGLVCLDVLADMFSGSEIDRSQATQFLGLLKRVCRDHECAVLLLAQPSVSGMATDSGTSGSTGWGNSGRSRLWFKRVKDDNGNELNKDLRTFQGKKNNYGEIGGKFDLEWKDGLYRRVTGPVGYEKMSADRKVEDEFLAKLKAFTKQGRNVSHRKGWSYAPAEFADNESEKAKFIAAMGRLFEAGKIIVEEYGPASRRRSRIVANG